MGQKLRNLLQTNGVDPQTIDNVETQVSQAQNGGRKLGVNAEQLMQMAGESFGADLSSVRVHNGTQAASMNSSLGARAFTTGRDIAFGQGQYSPDTQGSKTLLAHEVTHAVQQTNQMQAPANHEQKHQIKQMADKAAKGH